MTSRRWVLACTLCLCAPALAQFHASSAPGPYLIPSGAPGASGGGTWPGVAPPVLSTSLIPLATPVPPIATVITSINLYGLTHTWSGDLHFILVAPGGAPKYTLIHRPNFMNTSTFGQSCDYSGDYRVLDPAVPGLLPWPATSAACSGAAILPPGAYPQYVGSVPAGTWPSGTLGIVNVPLGAIPVVPGIWSLEIYDWAAGDVGSIVSWSMQGCTSGPTTCAPGVSSGGCVPVIGAPPTASIAFLAPCVITCAMVEPGKSGLFFYGLDEKIPHTPWGTGSLCIKAPLQRTTVQASGGAGPCTGAYALDFNAWRMAHPAALGEPWLAGDVLGGQYWYRDPPSAKTTAMSGAICLTFVP